jgi:2-polyprenyl-6-hydroxyphenyl methylase/3-demethylubiquinone-9 3-methyltransferase
VRNSRPEPTGLRGGAALERALRRYDAAPLPARLLVRGRAILADLLAIEPLVPRAGTILDLGCGHGLLANLLHVAAPDRRVTGIDPDPRKIAVAKLTERDGLHFALGDATAAELPPCDAVTLVDVLYLLPDETQERLIARAAAALRPGGRLVVYAQERRADVRFWLGYAQELVAAGLGLTRGPGGLHYARREEMRERLMRAGLSVEILPLAKRLYTDAIYVGRRA